MGKDLKDVAVIVAEKAYGAYGKQMLKNLFKKKRAKAKETDGPKKDEQVNVAAVPQAEVSRETPAVEPVQTEMPKPAQENVSEGQEPAVEEVTADKQETQTSAKSGKEEYPTLFSLFCDMMGGEEKKEDKADEVLEEMLMAAFASWMGMDVYKERLEEIEKSLQQAAERERQEKLREQETKEQPIPSLAQTQNATQEKRLSPAEAAYAKMADGKEQVTLGDLEKAGVNLKTDLQPTLKALTKDHPEKLSELAPKGLGDRSAPVNKEFAVALIARKQQREAIVRNNANVRP